jgi:hypothetical protein
MFQCSRVCLPLTFSATASAGLRGCVPVRWHKCIHAGADGCKHSETRIAYERVSGRLFSFKRIIKKFKYKSNININNPN